MDLLQNLSRTSLYASTFVLLLLTGCDGGLKNEQREAPRDTIHGPHALDDFPNTHVKKYEMECAEAEFKDIVHSGTEANHHPIATSTIQFSVESFNELKANFTTCKDTAGLVIHYGLEASTRKLSLAFSPVCIDLVDYVGQYTIPLTPLYVLDPDAKFVAVANGGLATWRSGPGRAFQEQVVVDKYDHGRFQLIYTNKYAHMVYTFGQIDSLIRDNGLSPEHFVEIVPVAEPEKWSKKDRGAEFSMKTCLVAKNSAGRLISDNPNSPGSGTYRNRASDLGSACPPLCDGWAVFAKHGTDVRKSCKGQ